MAFAPERNAWKAARASPLASAALKASISSVILAFSAAGSDGPRPSVRDHKMAPALHPAKDEREMKTKATTLKPRRTRSADAVRSLLHGGRGRKNKKRPLGVGASD